MGLLADPWKMGVASTRGAPSEEPAALEHEVLEPAEPESAAPEPTCLERLSSVQTSQWEVCIAEMWVVPWVEGPPEEAGSKWRNLEG